MYFDGGWINNFWTRSILQKLNLKFYLQICYKDRKVPRPIAVDYSATAAFAVPTLLVVFTAAGRGGQVRGTAAVQLLQAVPRPRPFQAVHTHTAAATAAAALLLVDLPGGGRAAESKMFFFYWGHYALTNHWSSKCPIIWCFNDKFWISHNRLVGFR